MPHRVYARTYTRDEVAHYRCRFDGKRMYEDCMRRWTTGFLAAHPLWVRRPVPVALIDTYQRGECENDRVARYIARRRAGGRFPAVILTPKRRRRDGSQPWYAIDGNHRAAAASCVGDRMIDAFLPVRRPPRP